MIDERPVRLAVEKVIAKHQVLWVLDRINALDPGAHWWQRMMLIAELASATERYKNLCVIGRNEREQILAGARRATSRTISITTGVAGDSFMVTADSIRALIEEANNPCRPITVH